MFATLRFESVVYSCVRVRVWFGGGGGEGGCVRVRVCVWLGGGGGGGGGRHGWSGPLLACTEGNGGRERGCLFSISAFLRIIINLPLDMWV